MSKEVRHCFRLPDPNLRSRKERNPQYPTPLNRAVFLGYGETDSILSSRSLHLLLPKEQKARRRTVKTAIHRSATLCVTSTDRTYRQHGSTTACGIGLNFLLQTSHRSLSSSYPPMLQPCGRRLMESPIRRNAIKYVIRVLRARTGPGEPFHFAAK